MKKRNRWKRRKTRSRRVSFEQLEVRSLLAAISTGLEGPSSPEFRTFDGSLNNLVDTELGSAGQPLLRQTTVDYADDISEPRGGSASTLTSPRVISNAIHAQGSHNIVSALGLSQMVFQFGQFLDHDITLTPTSDQPFHIPVPIGDIFFDPGNTGSQVIPLSRSEFDPASGTDANHPRQQTNLLTSYIDGSVIYGSDDDRALALRTLQGGKLIMRDDGLLPLNGVDTALLENLNEMRADPNSLFVSGDVRANEQIGLTAMHTLFSREHNYWADRIAAEQFADQDLNAPSVDERIYQLARQIVGTELQIITYNEFLPAVLGEDGMSSYQGYDAGVDPRISNIFATAAFRVGHTMLPSDLSLVDLDGSLIETRALSDAFFQPQVVTAVGIEPILLGLAVKPQQEVDRFMIDGVRNFLFGPPGAGGFDLASLNIQRGRDHGLPSYNQTRIDFGLDPAISFADISADADTQAALSAAYSSIDEVDIWVGGLAEDHLTGSSLGETFQRIWVDQFTRLRDGDRYFYKNLDLDTDLVNELESTTLSDIIVRNSAIESLPAGVFHVPVYDFGDAADETASSSYPTRLSQNGARHIVGPLFLGATVDDEADGQPTAAADGDDANGSDDDDGVTFLASLVASSTTGTTSSLIAVSSGTGKLDGWIDFNRDGDWDDAGEKIFASRPVVEGKNPLSITIPQGALPGETAARFRLSSAGDLDPTGEAVDGEVEDYIVRLLDGDVAGGIDAIGLASDTLISVSRESDQFMVRGGLVDLFGLPIELVGSFELVGSAGDETFILDMSDGPIIPPRGLTLDGIAGENKIDFTGDGSEIDLTQPLFVVRNISMLDISGSGVQTLTLHAPNVTSLSPTEKILTVLAGDEDTVVLDDAEKWRLSDPVTNGGRFLLSAAKQAGSNETLRVDVPRPWQNFLNFADVNNDGSITAGDALQIVNELGRHQYSDTITSDLLDPSGMSVWPGVYFDHNGDNRVTALDALRVVNDLARQLEVPEGEAATVSWVVVSQNALPRTEFSDSSEIPSTFSREFLVNASAAPLDSIVRLTSMRDQDRPDTDETKAAVDHLLENHSFFDRLSN